MPFLFDRDTSEDSNRPKGRRAFNKKGVEVVEKVVEKVQCLWFSSADLAAFDTLVQPKIEENSSSSQPKDSKSVQDQSRQRKRPATISGSKEAKPKKIASTRTVKEMIHDNSGVGTDLRSTSNARIAQTTSLTSVFLKPSGVDEPLDNTRSRAHGDNPPTSNGIAKRGRAVTSELADENKKRKKKKSSVE